MELASKYDPQAVESKWYQYWLDNKLFSSKPDGRKPYTIVIPPPNVTGVNMKKVLGIFSRAA
jgi:valyl-tRNA synthetase